MNNPKFQCIFPNTTNLILRRSLTAENDKEWLVLEIHEDSGSDCLDIDLNQASALRLAEEIKSWVDTGEFKKPLKEFVLMGMGNGSLGFAPVNYIQRANIELAKEFFYSQHGAKEATYYIYEIKDGEPL